MLQMLRFIASPRKLGFDGYSDFKSFLNFEDSKNHQLPSDSMEQFKQEIENTFNYLERIDYRLLTHKMHHATTIYLYGTGRAQMNVAEEAQRILLTMHKNIILLHDVHESKDGVKQDNSRRFVFHHFTFWRNTST